MKLNITCLLSIASLAICVSCGGTGATQSSTSGIKFRAFVSNPFQLGGGGGIPILNIVDTTHDKLSNFSVSIASQSQEPNQMVLSPNKNLMMVYSEAGATITVVDVTREAIARNGNAAVPAIHLPGPTQSFFVAADNSTAYVAVPNAPTVNQGSPGQVEVLNLGVGGVAARIDVPSASFVVGDTNTARVVVFANDSDVVTVISTSLIGSGTLATTSFCLTPVASGAPCPYFYQPVQGILGGDGTKLFILDCGPECGRTQAGVQVLDLTAQCAQSQGICPAVIKSVPLPAATFGLLQGNTLYVAGTAPGVPCADEYGPTTAATSCGTLSIVDVTDINNPSVNQFTATITDGYHQHMEMGTHNRLFVGARNCTNVGVDGLTSGEVRGCLSVVDTDTTTPDPMHPNKLIVDFPNVTGDVTGLQHIPNRDVVYVAQNGELEVYDTITLQQPPPNETAIDIVGQANDVKIVY